MRHSGEMSQWWWMSETDLWITSSTKICIASSIYNCIMWSGRSLLKIGVWNAWHHHWLHYMTLLNTLRPRHNGRHFADDTFKCIFLNENVRISIKISLKFVPKGPINNIPALVQIMAWHRSGDKPLSEPMMVSLLTHICVTRPQWVNQCWLVISKAWGQFRKRSAAIIY